MEHAAFAIGSKTWPGISKLVEELGEVAQVAGKLIATGGRPGHWDGTDLRTRLEDELADLSAAIAFVISQNALDTTRIADRRGAKLRQFEDWHRARGLRVRVPLVAPTGLERKSDIPNGSSLLFPDHVLDPGHEDGFTR